MAPLFIKCPREAVLVCCVMATNQCPSGTPSGMDADETSMNTMQGDNCGVIVADAATLGLAISCWTIQPKQHAPFYGPVKIPVSSPCLSLSHSPLSR